jgi:hypothetical protein
LNAASLQGAAVIFNCVHQLVVRRDVDAPSRISLARSLNAFFNSELKFSALQFWRDPGYEQEDENLQKVRIWVTLFGRVRGVPTRGQRADLYLRLSSSLHPA